MQQHVGECCIACTFTDVLLEGGYVLCLQLLQRAVQIASGCMALQVGLHAEHGSAFITRKCM